MSLSITRSPPLEVQHRVRHPAQFGRYHWHIEIAPIFAKKGGLEYGSQCMVLMVSPEVAARNLRETDAAQDDDDDDDGERQGVHTRGGE